MILTKKRFAQNRPGPPPIDRGPTLNKKPPQYGPRRPYITPFWATIRFRKINKNHEIQPHALFKGAAAGDCLRPGGDAVVRDDDPGDGGGTGEGVVDCDAAQAEDLIPCACTQMGVDRMICNFSGKISLAT